MIVATIEIDNPCFDALKEHPLCYWSRLMSIVFVAFYRLPKPEGRTYGEMDIVFEQEIPARKFKHAVVDPFSVQDTAIQLMSSSKKE